MTITRIHWSELSPELGPLAKEQPCFAIWPEPIDHDSCFEAAGFSGFADTDAAWDADFSSLVEALFKALSACGQPTLIAGELPVRRLGLLRKETGSIVEAVVCAATDDQFAPCCVGFGNPPAAHLLASDGHPLIWLYPGRQIQIANILESVAGARDLEPTALDWSVLVPTPNPTSSDGRP